MCLPSDALLQHVPSYLGFSYLGRGASPLGRCFSPWMWGICSRLLLLMLDVEHLLLAAAPDLGHGVSPQAASTDLGRLLSILVRLLLQHHIGPFALLQMTEFPSFYDSVIFYCVNIPHLLYTYSLSWTLELSPCLANCRRCCCER